MIKFKAFAYAVKDDKGNIIGGIHGWRAFDEIYILMNFVLINP